MNLDLYDSILRPVFFRLEPEKAHELAMGLIRRALPFYGFFHSQYSPRRNDPVTVGSVTFRNRLGLAAGFDKNGINIRFWDAIGFSHAEIGTVTPLPQPGNEKPRLFRLPADSALINRLGFNNEGAEKVRRNILEARRRTAKDFVIGVNIGKNKDTPLEEAGNDYRKCFEMLYDAADYFTVNISSPNTPGLRLLQDESNLKQLLAGLREVNEKMSAQRRSGPKDIFLKIAPDISAAETASIYNACCEYGISAIIATNTTVGRPGLKQKTDLQGGLSGRPLKKLSGEILNSLSELKNRAGGNSPDLIGAGGVFSKEDFADKLRLGAKLVQVYTGFVYEGPALIRSLLD